MDKAGTVAFCTRVSHLNSQRKLDMGNEFPTSVFETGIVNPGECLRDMEKQMEKMNKDVSLRELSERMAEFAQVRGWDKYHSPRNLLLALVGEVGELSEIFQWKGEVARGLPNWSAADKEHLEEELSDVLLYLVRLADVCGLDLGRAVLSKILKNATKYPLIPHQQIHP